jgi:hypothetical protein
MAFDKIIVSSLTKAIKSTALFELSIDEMISQFDKQCPNKENLKRIIQQKNKITSALIQIKNGIKPIQTTSETVGKVITGLNITINIIKSLPIPTSVPPGVGIPLNVITKLSDTLDQLSTLSQRLKGNTQPIPQVIENINQLINNIIQKLNLLEVAISKCLEKTLENMSEDEKQKYIKEIESSVSLTTDLENSLPQSGDESLISQLQPNSSNPIIYKGFTLILQSNIDNTLSFPQRRIQSKNDRGVVLYNTEDGKYSFSSSTQILIDEAKFIIDQYVISLN